MLTLAYSAAELELSDLPLDSSIRDHIKSVAPFLTVDSRTQESVQIPGSWNQLIKMGLVRSY